MKVTTVFYVAASLFPLTSFATPLPNINNAVSNVAARYLTSHAASENAQGKPGVAYANAVDAEAKADAAKAKADALAAGRK